MIHICVSVWDGFAFASSSLIIGLLLCYFGADCDIGSTVPTFGWFTGLVVMMLYLVAVVVGFIFVLAGVAVGWFYPDTTTHFV